MSSYPGSLSVVYKKEEANAEAAGRNGIKYLITKSLPDNMQGWTLFSQDASVNILKNTAYQPMIRFENEKCETRIESVENGKIATKLFNENEKPEKLIILIPWHQGWQLNQEFMRGKVTLIGCPKLDAVDYSEKLTEILRSNDIQSVTILRMEVPCCGGLEMAAKKALQTSGKFIPWQVVTISIDGKILD